MTGALAAVAPLLRCPNCAAPLAAAEAALRCAAGHSFDVARQGYVTLGPLAAGDSAAMVEARERFLGAGHYEPIARAVAEAAPSARVVVDIGAGTGYYLAALLEDGVGVALDSSRPALRRAARVHPRIAAVGCDVWRELPLQDGAADLLVNVFAPRNGAEIVRVLAPGGVVVVVTPTPGHLAELAEFGTLAVEPEKEARLHAQLAPLRPVQRWRVEFQMELSAAEAAALIAMGPSAHHATRAVTEAMTVTASVNVETFSRS